MFSFMATVKISVSDWSECSGGWRGVWKIIREQWGFIQQILLAGFLGDSNEKGLFISLLWFQHCCTFGVSHSSQLSWKRGGLSSGHGESRGLIWKPINYIFFLVGSGDLPEGHGCSGPLHS